MYVPDTNFPYFFQTIGAAFCRKDINVEGLLLSLAIWVCNYIKSILKITIKDKLNGLSSSNIV
jgi:hypothetical protein